MTLWLVTNLVVSAAYLAIALRVATAVLAHERTWRSNPLALATAAIFFSCGVGHGLHGLTLLSASSHHTDHVSVPLVVWDGLTATVAVWYWSLRKLFPALRSQQGLFETGSTQDNRLLATALDALPEDITLLDVERDAAGDAVDLRIRWANRSAVAKTGVPLADMAGQRLADVFPSLVRLGYVTRYLQIANGGVGATLREDDFVGDITSGSVEVSVVPWDGGLLVAVRDTSEQVRATRALRRSESLLAEAQRLAGLGSWELDLTTGDMSWSEEAARLVGLPASTRPSAAALVQRCHPDDRETLQRGLEALLGGAPTWVQEWRVLLSTGEVRHLLGTGRAEGEDRALGSMQDVTELRRRERSLAAEALTDALTGLPNRRAWDRAAGAYGQISDSVLVLLDLDHFKDYNDTYGHPAGDVLLRACAEAWRARLRHGDLLCRLGGEEFALLLAGCSISEAGQVVEQLRQAVPTGMTVSAGVVELGDGLTVLEGMRAADRALYVAKAKGRNRMELADRTIMTT